MIAVILPLNGLIMTKYMKYKRKFWKWYNDFNIFFAIKRKVLKQIKYFSFIAYKTFLWNVEVWHLLINFIYNVTKIIFCLLFITCKSFNKNIDVRLLFIKVDYSYKNKSFLNFTYIILFL